MILPSIDRLKAFILLCLLVPFLYLAAEGYITWVLDSEWIFYLNNRDYYTAAFCLLPTALGHLATIWGHYFRSAREFQHGIDAVTAPSTEKQKYSLWEHRVLRGYTIKYWVLVVLVVLLNCAWVALAVAPYAKEIIEDYGPVGAAGLIIGEIGGYAAIASCGLILFFVLRRSMLQAIGFTYSDILPFHRWLGVAIVFWSVIHTVGYVMYYAWDHSLGEAFNFYDMGRSTMNIMGCFALGALLILAFFSIPQVRRRSYTLFMTLHRVMTVIFLVGTIVHYPYFMLWYYLLPSVVLFYVDRFIPRVIQSRSLYPEASCTFNADADIIKMTLRSPEPMKPYYPGDYIMIRVPELGILPHPFTIASYWPDDPSSIVLYIRAYYTKGSWTGDMSRLCGVEDKRIRIKTDADGIFGDRRHDYLKSDVIIVFAAGAAITTFMALIKAIGAQINASNQPLRIQFNLICTFRTRSELHAYGSFLHQITRDPRFTSWLNVEIYVSRPDKPKTLMGAHAHVIKNDILVPGKSVAKQSKNKKRFSSLRRTGTMLKRALSGRTVVNVPGISEKIETRSTELDGAVNAVHDGVVRSPSGDTVRIPMVDGTSGEDIKQIKSSQGSSACSLEDLNATLPSSPISVNFDESSFHHATIKALIGGDTKPSADHPSSSLPPVVAAAADYSEQPLRTFQDADSGHVSSRLARLDLTATAILIVIPLAAWFGLRAVKWEGPEHYCDIMADMTATQNKICYGIYSTAPVAGHMLLMFAIGYLANWLARKHLIRSLAASCHRDIETGSKHYSEGSSSSNSSSSSSSKEKNLPYPDLELEDEQLSTEDGNWDEGDVVYSVGRMNVKIVVDRFVNAGVGVPVDGRHALVTVFGGGPEAFVEHVGRQVKVAKWVVSFHSETWAP
ncbi:hypothetical protein BGZ99_004979 [Dissophora globulifera]|uniref:FAD-binding FR-type domain-containing protein n=1 Tax=Dissophora globulifera TaxID=979702 RepID=A0A9P6RKL6_9FUNG|nr:hypothetical protein BGZ99_004979 [Dissophora globulifera]